MVVHNQDTRVEARDFPLTFGALMLAMVPAAVDQTILSTALPAISSEFGGMNRHSWVVTAYILAMIASAVAWGRLGDQVGRKPLFGVAMAVFLIGSALCGLAWSMGSLITFRALQGVGAGGLIVLTQTIVGDLVGPLERGRYQGFVGAVFGVSSIVGPLFGGFFVDQLSWRWLFFVNLPLGVIVFTVIAIVLQGKSQRVEHPIDHLAVLLLAASVCLLLTTMLNLIRHGLTPTVAGLGVPAVLSAVGWGLAERRAPEPMLLLRLFRNPVFCVGSALDAVAGFVMFGCLIYLPVFLQVVKGSSAALSGFYLVPMVLGVLAMAVLSGHLISLSGRYRIFPILGMALTVLGLYLCSRMDALTSVTQMSVYLGVVGCGLGLVVQVPIIAVQNSVDYRDLGVATSGVTLFRALGALMGVTVFSAILLRDLAARLAAVQRSIRLPPGLDAISIRRDPRLLSGLPPADRAEFVAAFAQAFHTMFLWAIPVALAGLVLALFLREVPLRPTAAVADIGVCLGGVPVARSSRNEIERLLFLLLRRNPKAREKSKEVYSGLAAEAGVRCPPESVRVLCRVAGAGSLPRSALAGRAGVTAEEGGPFVDRLVAEGLVTEADGHLVITDTGRAVVERLHESMRQTLVGLLEGWSPEDHPDLVDLLASLSRESMCEEVDLPMRESAPSAVK